MDEVLKSALICGLSQPRYPQNFQRVHSLAINTALRPYPLMPMSPPPDRLDQRKRAQQIRALREQLGLTQGQVAAPLGMSTQGYQKYEAGERRLTSERLAAIAAAMGLTPDNFDAELARIGGAPPRPANDIRARGEDMVFDIYTRARAGPQGPAVFDAGEPLRSVRLRDILGAGADALEVAGESMTPWAEAGDLILFDRDRHPRRGHGCVVEMKSGEFYVKLYERTAHGKLWLRELFPEERLIDFDLDQVKGVFEIRLRGN